MPKTKTARKTPPVVPASPSKKPTKIEVLLDLLRRPEGARIDEMMAATGWQAHSVRGAIAGAIKKKLGLAITSEKVEVDRVYRVTEAQA
jgi:hypothetical protein